MHFETMLSKKLLRVARMLTLSIIWLVLATAVTIVATARKQVMGANSSEARDPETGSALAVLAIAYGVILLAGVLYVGWHHSTGLIH